MTPREVGPVLVTGAGGQLGRAFARLVPDAVLLTRRDLDVTDRDAVARAVRRPCPAVVVHAAAWTKVDEAEANPGAARAVNVDGTEAVAAAAAAVGALLVYPSTDYVFDGMGSRPYREEDPARPLSVYGATKLEGEEAARGCTRHLVVRTSWMFGEGPNFVGAILRAARERRAVEVVRDQVGLPTYAPDLARAILDLIARGAAGTFHLSGGGDPCSWADLAERVLVAAKAPAGAGPRVRRITTEEYAAARTGPVARRPLYSVLDSSKAAALGVRLRPWRTALREYVAGPDGVAVAVTGAVR